MGAWSTRIFDNDTAMDILTEYKKLLGYGVEPEEVYRKISDYYAKDYIGQDDEDDYWLALAYFQWKNGILTDEVKENALRCLDDDSFLDRWRESGKTVYEKRKKTIGEFKYNLLNVTNPRKKKFPKCPAYLREKTPYKVGDVITYKSVTQMSNSQSDLFSRVSKSSEKIKDKYFMFKVIDIKKDPVSRLCPELDYSSSPIVALYDWIGDTKPTFEEVSRLHLRYFIESADWIEYNFDTLARLETPYLEKSICYGLKVDLKSQLGDKVINEVEVIGNDNTKPEDYDEFRKKFPDLIVFEDMDMVLFYTFADYDNLKYD